MNRIDEKLLSLKSKGEKALSLFVTAGIPHLRSTVPLVLDLEHAGADIIELGMPFSDPLADGAIIQQSSVLAIRNGVTVNTILNDVREIRATSNIPVVLMGYLNPILRFGRGFFAAAEDAGVDGIILPELPLEESVRFRSRFDKSNLANILLVAPTSSTSRILSIDAACSGFLYCVSMTGVTGSNKTQSNTVYVRSVKTIATNPVLVGFGIASPEDAREYSKIADGVIVGSALIKRILAGDSGDTLGRWVAEFKDRMRASAAVAGI